MKKSNLIVLGVTLLLATPVTAQDQMQLGNMAAKDSRSADKALNKTYQLVLLKYSDNSQFISKLKQAELAWIKFRDAYTDSVFPEAKTNPDYYGSAFDMCWSATVAQQTTQRTSDLKKLLGGPPAIVTDTKNKLAAASAEVGRLYQSAVKVKHDDEPSFAAKFKKAQDAWSAFANADADAWSALASATGKDATKLSRLCELNQLRAKSLNEWIKGIPEGDVCTGSRKVQE
ncbi:MAG: LprI family protein [Candidatus Obscuribacterales bacterium]|nr:LprI family protein [Candidatus Obscuribacterales bacterium]